MDMRGILHAARAGAARAVAPAAGLVRRHPRASVYGLSLLLHLLLAPFLIHDWDGYVFIQTADDFLHGQSPYATVEAEPSYVFIGDGVPVVNSWYAYPPVALLLMTPFYGLATFLLGSAPWVERLGVKLPLILGDLALAFVAAGLVRAALRDEPEKAERRARLVERVLLLNPFLIFISAAWGMFDSWMMAFLVGSLWALTVRRPGLAGASFALAVLVKPFPVLALPLVAAYAYRQTGRDGLLRWTGAGALAGVAVCLPFFLDSPAGFLQQVVFNHTSRPPQGFTLIGVPLAFGWVNGILGTSLPADVTPEALSRWSFFLLLCVLAVVWLQAGSVRTARDVAHLSLVAFVGTLLVSKVVNEQYFVMPLVLAAVAFALSERPLHLWVRRLYTFGGVVSGLLLGYHFFTFIPLDVGRRVFPYDPLEATPRLTSALGLTGEQAFVYPTLLAAAALVPALAASLWLLGRQVAAPLRPLRRLSWRDARPPKAAVALLVTLLVVAPLSATVLSATGERDPAAAYVQPEGPLVGAYYYLWWHNPSHDPDVLYGNWQQGVTHTPLDGYYTTTAGKMRGDFRAMKANGIDLAVYSYTPDAWPKLPAIVRVGAETGVATAPLVELSDLLHRSEHQPRDANGTPVGESWGLSLRNGTRDAIVDRVVEPLSLVGHFPAWWRVDGRPVVLLRPTHAAFHDHDGETRERLVDAALALARTDAEQGRAAAAPTREALEATFPATPDALRQPGASLWRRAYHDVVRAFWEDVERAVTERYGPVHLVGGLTWDPSHGSDRGASLGLARMGALGGSFIPSASDVWQGHLGDSYDAQVRRWKDATLVEAQAARAAGGPVVASVTPGHDDRPLRKEHGFVLPHEDNGTLTYDLLWEHALALRPDVVLVDSWNNFRAGNGVEPTLEWKDALLARTASYAARLKAQEDAGPAQTLLVTNHLGATYHPDSGDPDGSYAMSMRLARAAEARWPGRVAAVDWNGPLVDDADLSAHGLVVVEPGSKRAHTREAEDLVGRLRAYAEAGGHVLLLGSDVGVHYARLVGWSEPPLPSARLGLETPEGLVPLPVDARATFHVPPADARVLLWMTDGQERYPALWQVDVGNGTLAVTAFRPQGVAEGQDVPPGVFPLMVARALGQEAAP